MTAPTDAVFAFLGDVTGSSRALRQLRVWDALGLRTVVVGVGPPRDPAALPASVRLRALPVPAGRGPLFFGRAHRAVRAEATAWPARLYLASDLYTLPALAAAARTHGGALGYDSRELYAALDATAGRPLVARGWRAVERRAIGRADGVLTVGDAIADRLAAAYGIERPTVLYNAPDEAAAAPPDRRALRRTLGLPDDGRTLVLYQGLFREGRGLPALLDAAAHVEGVRVVLIGEGALADALRQRAAALGDRAVVHPFVPPDRLAALTPGADLGTCLIEPLTESLRLSLPNKLFEYLAAGVPVLASPLPEIRRVVEAFDVGPLADPSDPAALARALRAALDPAALARWAAHAPAALDAFSWAHGAERFRRWTLRLLDAPPA